MEITMIIDAEESLSIFWSVEFKTTKCIDFVQARCCEGTTVVAKRQLSPNNGWFWFAGFISLMYRCFSGTYNYGGLWFCEGWLTAKGRIDNRFAHDWYFSRENRNVLDSSKASRMNESHHLARLSPSLSSTPSAWIHCRKLNRSPWWMAIVWSL